MHGKNTSMEILSPIGSESEPALVPTRQFLFFGVSTGRIVVFDCYETRQLCLLALGATPFLSLFHIEPVNIMQTAFQHNNCLQAYHSHTNGAPWSSDGELTPLFPPRTLDYNALRRELGEGPSPRMIDLYITYSTVPLPNLFLINRRPIRAHKWAQTVSQWQSLRADERWSLPTSPVPRTPVT